MAVTFHWLWVWLLSAVQLHCCDGARYSATEESKNHRMIPSKHLKVNTCSLSLTFELKIGKSVPCLFIFFPSMFWIELRELKTATPAATEGIITAHSCWPFYLSCDWTLQPQGKLQHCQSALLSTRLQNSNANQLFFFRLKPPRTRLNSDFIMRAVIYLYWNWQNQRFPTMKMQINSKILDFPRYFFF